MAVRTQPSSSSLSRYAVAKSPGVDLYNGSSSRDFCNSFWGVSDAGVNILFARLRGAARTTDDLRKFWKERSLIEEEYAMKLAKLSNMTLGNDEIGELRNAVDTVRLETEKLASSHLRLASQIRSELEEPTIALLNKEIEHRRNVQGPVEKKYKAKLAAESHVTKARDKYHTDVQRITSYKKQLELNPGRETERLQMKLNRAEQTVDANEKDYAKFSQILKDMMPGWEADWKEFCDSCQDMEEERVEFIKDNLWTYANAVSTVCVTDDLSCETIRTVLDQLEPDREIEHFVQEYGTGNTVQEPTPFVPYDGREPPPSSIPSSVHVAGYKRISKRPVVDPVIPTQSSPPDPRPQQQPKRGDGGLTLTIDGKMDREIHGGNSTLSNVQVNGKTENGAHHPPTNASTSRRRVSQPLPEQPQNTPPNPPPEPMPSPLPNETGGILFYVKALYDYTATIEEEFDFQAGDVIAVTATPDDGWWSGELLDEARREEGRHIFPSNFVCLF